jgi:photosystem II stability/assembly factor-like uncharacterized protein
LRKKGTRMWNPATSRPRPWGDVRPAAPGWPAAFAVAATLAAAVVPGAPLCAGVGAWTQVGPYGGQVNTLTFDPVHPATVYAGTGGGGGAFKSTDRGVTWMPIHQGLLPLYVDTIALVVDPENPSTLYLANRLRDGLFKSIDGGANWKPIGPAAMPTSALAVDPRDSRTLYAGFDRGLQKSVDGGATWTESDAGMPGFQVISVTVDPHSSATLYAGFANGGDGIFKSTDAGKTWTVAGAPPPPAPCYAVIVDPLAPLTIYTASGGRVYKSVNGGGSWQRMDQGLGPDFIVALVLDPGPSHALYAAATYGKTGLLPGGVFKSVDGGASWTAAADQGLADPEVVALAIDPAGSGTLFAGTLGLFELGGLFKSVDGAAHWTVPAHGPSAVDITDFAISPLGGDTLYAGTFNEGLMVSHDGGGSWSLAPGLPGLVDPTIALDPVSPGTLYVGSGSFVNSGGGISFHVSRDGGATWSPFPAPASIATLAVDPQDDSILYGFLGTGSPLGVQGIGIERSADGGATWITPVGADMQNAFVTVVIDPSTPSNVYAFGGLPNHEGARIPRLYKSVDRGLTWAQIAPSLGLIDQLAVDPNDSVVYATSGGQLLKSTDGGLTWANVSPPDPAGRASVKLAIAPTQPATVYVVLGRTGLVSSADGGATWSAVTTAGLVSTIGGLKFDPLHPQDLIAAVDFSGLEALTLPGPSVCVPATATLCLNAGRFQVGASWHTARDAGAAQVLSLTPDTGALWFFSAANLELLVKVLDGCALNGHYWVFAGGLTNVGVTLTVTDSQTGVTRNYVNANRVPFAPVQDTLAFDRCP